MYPVSKHMTDVHSGTGVFYQAIPAVGADGKKIMKLIPVQQVKGRCVQYEPSLDSTTQEDVNISSQPANFKHIVRNKDSFGNVLTQGAGLDQSPNKHPRQQRTESLMSKVPMTTMPAADCVTSLSLPCQRPVMVKSPALPRGQVLRIPPNAHVRTLPASELPPDIKKQIFNSSANSTPGSDLPDVLFVSPVTTVRPCAAPPGDSGPSSPRLPSQTTAKTSKPFLKLIPKASSNGPIRWVVEEEDAQTAPPVHPLNLQTVAQRKKIDQHSNLDKSGREQDNALIMCNGKVFFVAKKCSLLFKPREKDSATAATRSSEIKETTDASFRHAMEATVARTQPDVSIIISDEPDQVIDLCDDNTQDNSQQAALVKESAATHQEDDNVIFVSYMPPKSESTGDLTVKTHTTLETDKDLLSTSSLDSLTQEQSSGGRADADASDEGAARVCASAGANVHYDDNPNMAIKPSASTQQAPPHPAVCRTSPPAPPSCKMSDRQLSQTFGITSDVKICLRRIDAASTAPAEARSRDFLISADDQHEPENGSIKDEPFYTPCENQNNDVRTVVVLPEQDQPAGVTTAHTDVTPLQCASVSEPGGSSPEGVPRGVENTTLIGYVEPIDDDFLCANEIAEQTQTCVDLNTSRIGRARKRTTCPCCVPSAPEPALKSAARSEEP